MHLGVASVSMTMLDCAYAAYILIRDTYSGSI